MKKNILSQLKKEHEEVKEKLSEAESCTPPKRQELLEEIEELLVTHARGEEKTLYSMLRKRAKENSGDDLELANEAYEEHRVADQLIEELKDISVNDEKWIAHLKVLKENIEHHIKEEENELFSKAREYFSSEELVEILPVYMDVKDRYLEHLPSQSQIRERRESPELRS